MQTKIYATVIRTATLNVRKEPKGAVIGALRLGDRVEILEQKEVSGVPWGRCDKGWINMRTYVRLETVEVPYEPPVQEPQEPQNPETSVNTREYATVVSTGSLTVFDQPDGNRVSHLNPGEQVELLERQELHGRVWGRCAKGWFRLRSNVRVDTVLTDGQEDDNSYVRVDTFANVEEDSIPVMDAPGGMETGKLLSGDQVQLLEYSMVENVLWGRCAQGWINLRDQVRLSTEIRKDGQGWTYNVTVSAACLNLRSKAEKGSPVVCRLYQGTTVTVLQVQAVEDRIWARTALGWIDMDLLERT